MRVLFGKFKLEVVFLDEQYIYSHKIKEHLQHLTTSSSNVFRSKKRYVRCSSVRTTHKEFNFPSHTITADGIIVDVDKTTAFGKINRCQQLLSIY